MGILELWAWRTVRISRVSGVPNPKESYSKAGMKETKSRVEHCETPRLSGSRAIWSSTHDPTTHTLEPQEWGVGRQQVIWLPVPSSTFVEHSSTCF